MLSAEPQQSEMSMSGKTVLSTGATSGLGLATALLLAERGAEIVMVGRDRTRANFMRREIAQYASDSEPILFLADLSSQAEIHRLAEKLHGSLSRIDVLINNAAAVFAERETTTDGLENTFAVNHLAPFILTHLVLDLVRAAPAGRILTASSEFHSGELDFSNLQGERQYNWLGAYRRSRLCNILFTYELSRRLEGSTITANCFSPGPTLTRLGDNMRGLPAAVPWLLKRIPSLLAFPEGAARTPVYVASGSIARLRRPCRAGKGKTVIDAMNAFGVPPEELDDLPSSAFVAKAFTGAKIVKGFNHLIAATLVTDPIVEGGHRVVFLSSDDEDATAPVAALAKQLGFAPVKLGKLNEGGALVHARGRTWGQLIFQDLFKKEQ